MPVKEIELNAKNLEKIQKLQKAENEVINSISQSIFNNLDKVLELVSEEKLLGELEKRIKIKKVKFDNNFLISEKYKLNLRKINQKLLFA